MQLSSDWGLCRGGGLTQNDDSRGTFLGVLIKRSLVYEGLYTGPLILGNYQVGVCGMTRGQG